MNSRILYRLLTNALDVLTAQPSLLGDIFPDMVDEESSEFEDLKKWFAAQKPAVRHQYVRDEDPVPLYSIVLANERETELYIGNDGSAVDLDGSGLIGPGDPDFGDDLKGSIWEHSFAVHCYDRHPLSTQYLYEIAKYVFLSADLGSHGIIKARFSGGDLAPDPRYTPPHLFARVFQVTFDKEYERFVRTAASKAFAVRGIHIDRAGSPTDPGTKTLVDVE